jgi:hypothetical protein
MLSVPAAKPLTTPPITIAAPPLLLQTPPVAASLKVILSPTHTLPVPVIVPASGNGFTVTLSAPLALPQLLLTTYLIVSTPAETPETMPPKTLADALLLLHVALVNGEPVEPSVKTIVEPTHTFVNPLILPATGIESIVITSVSMQPVTKT